MRTPNTVAAMMPEMVTRSMLMAAVFSASKTVSGCLVIPSEMGKPAASLTKSKLKSSCSARRLAATWRTAMTASPTTPASTSACAAHLMNVVLRQKGGRFSRCVIVAKPADPI